MKVNMEKEILFAEKLKEIREIAKKQGGMVTQEQVKEAFASFALQEEQMEMVREYLKKHHVGIGVPIEEEEYLTDGERNFLKAYLEEIEALDTVSEGEREAITLSAMAGDGEAQDRLLTLYLPKVVDVAKLYTGQGVFLEDLIGEGNVAAAMGVKLLGALEHPSEAEGMLGSMMMEAMEEYIALNAEEGKKDQKIADKVNKVADAARKLAEEYGRKVTAEELAGESSLSLKTIRDAIRMSGGKIEDLEDLP